MPPLVTAEVEDALKNCLILVVDDNAVNRKVLTGILSGGGFRRVLEAADGEEALALARDRQIDLMLLDLMMPGMSGFEVCEQVRGAAELADLPIVIQTAVADVSTRTKVFDSGASDLIAKPLNVTEVLGRVRVHLSNRLLLRDLRRFRERVSSELSIAQAVQLELLPRAEDLERLWRSHGLDVAGHFQPSSELGGDIWDVGPIDDQRVAIYLADFSGHGVGAALNTVRLSTLVDDVVGKGEAEPLLFMDKINRALRGRLPVGQFSTMLYGVVDLVAGRFDYAAAATPTPLRLEAASGTVQTLDGSGPLLGVLAEATFELRSVPFRPGDALVFYSDALVEVRDTAGTELDLSAVSDLIAATGPQATSATMVDSVLELFLPDRPPPIDDDLTIVAMRLAGTA